MDFLAYHAHMVAFMEYLSALWTFMLKLCCLEQQYFAVVTSICPLNTVIMHQRIYHAMLLIV